VRDLGRFPGLRGAEQLLLRTEHVLLCDLHLFLERLAQALVSVPEVRGPPETSSPICFRVSGNNRLKIRTFHGKLDRISTT
jgi:hypothetical protein